MGDAGFYRGTSSEQDSRFTDKERKLLKQMRFDGTLDEKICMERVNLEVLKPWITAKLIEILGVEDDVLVEYVFSQLEEKSLNPKVMQINLTGFLNAKRAREFMGELWTMLIEAQSSSDGIPASLVEKKMKEIQDRKAKSSTLSANGVNDAAGSDWKNRYDSLTGGKYGQRDIPSRRKEDMKRDDDRRRDNRDHDIDNSRRDQNKIREARRSRERENDEGDRRREREDRSRRDERRFDEKERHQSHSPARRYTSDDRVERRKVRSPPRRRFTERKDDQELNSSHRKKKHDSESSSSENEKSKRKKKKKHSRKHSGDSDTERVEKKKKKRKKDKKHRKRHSSESD